MKQPYRSPNPWNTATSTEHQKLLFASLYLSEGAPIGFIWLALPTRLRVRDVPIEQTTWLTAMLVLPWTFKFLWAPLLDTLRGPHWSLRHWIVSAEIVMGFSLLPLLWLDPVASFNLIATILLVHALAAATQDVAIDAYCISTTAPGERGAYNGWMQTGMLLGRGVMGGGALVMSTYLGDRFVIGILIALTMFSLLLVVWIPQTPHSIGSSQSSRSPASDWPLVVDRHYSSQHLGRLAVRGYGGSGI